MQIFMNYSLVEKSKDENIIFNQISLKALYITKMAYNSKDHKYNLPHVIYCLQVNHNYKHL